MKPVKELGRKGTPPLLTGGEGEPSSRGGQPASLLRAEAYQDEPKATKAREGVMIIRAR
jgi:hypothetical protein